MRRRIQRARREEGGFTLVELLVSMTIFSVLMAVILSLMITMMYQAKDNLGRQRAVEQGRLGLSQIDRQIRSGNLILDPLNDGVAESGVPANYSLRIYTQEGGDDMCVQWRVIFYDSSEFGQLEYREWDPVDTTTATPWSRVASNVVAPTSAFAATDPQSWPPFWVDTTLPTGTDAQNIRITLRMSDPDAKTSSKPQVLTSVITGRNTVFGYPSLTCNVVPTP
jgi:prepilin-type N-terminal cleavage/methylation domain-containing protein